MSLPPLAVEAFRRQKKRQTERRLGVGSAWQDERFCFDRYDGRPIDPDDLSNAFREAAEDAGIKGTRLHDLRHAYATALLRASIHPKVVSEQLGHSNIAITLDTYSHVIPTMG